MAAKTPAKPAAKTTKGKASKAPTAVTPITKKPPAKKPVKPRASRAKTATPEKAPDLVLTPEEQLVASMDPRHVQFVDAYLLTLNATKAYKAAGNEDMGDNTARSSGSRLLTNASVQKLLAYRIKTMFERNESLQDRMLAQQLSVAFADPNELVEHRREACRYCYGENFAYQYKPSEFADREREWEKELAKFVAEYPGADEADLPVFDPKGGPGFDPRREPRDDCPECFGEGTSRIVMKDTRQLSPGAQALYAGTKITKDGMEMVMHSQEKARDVLLKILKLYDDKTEVILGVLPPEKLDAIYANAMELAAKGREDAKKRREARDKQAQEGAK